MSDRHEWLDEALRLAAAEDARIIVPADVETRVMRGWDERQATGEAARGHGSRRAAWIAAAGVAAACAAGLVLLPRAGEIQPERQPGNLKSPAQREATGTPGAAADAAGAATPGTPVIESLPGAIAPTRVDASADAGTLRRETRSSVALGTMDYVLIPEPPVDTASLQVVRVRMSRTAFASLGVPIENPDADGLMEVEMIVGDDGVARSIRRATFVSVLDERGER